jgi:hypothetical protein
MMRERPCPVPSMLQRVVGTRMELLSVPHRVLFPGVPVLLETLHEIDLVVNGESQRLKKRRAPGRFRIRGSQHHPCADAARCFNP